MQKQCGQAALQDYENLEVVISENVSQDRSPEILQALKREFPNRVFVFPADTYINLTDNQIRAFKLCKGELISNLDGDDLMLPGKISKQVAYLQDNANKALCFHDAEVFDSDTNRKLFLWKDRFGAREGGAKTLVRYGNFICSPTVMVWKKYLPATGFDKRLVLTSDCMHSSKPLILVGKKWDILTRYLLSIAGMGIMRP